MTRQKVELLLPGDTDGSGYPGGIKQQFVAVRDMVEAILLQLKQLPDFQVLRLAWALHCHSRLRWGHVRTASIMPYLGHISQLYLLQTDLSEGSPKAPAGQNTCRIQEFKCWI